MSARLYGLVWKARLSRPSVKLVSARLAENARDDGTHIYPAISTVARETGLSDRTVQYALEALRLADLIAQVQAGGGRKKAAEYRINVARLQGVADSGETVQILHPFSSGKGCKRQRERVQTATEKGATVALEPLGTLKEPLFAAASAAAPDGAASADRPAEHHDWDLMCECGCQERLAKTSGIAVPSPATGRMEPQPMEDATTTDEDGTDQPGREPALIHVRDGTCRFRQRFPRDLRRGQDDCLERSLGTRDLSLAWSLRARAMEIAEAYFDKLRTCSSRAAADRWLGAAFAELRREIASPRPEQLTLPGLDGEPLDTDEAVRA